MSDFATFQDFLDLSGKEYTSAEKERVEKLIPLVCDALRFEAEKVGKDLDAMVQDSEYYGSIVKLVVVDVITRVLRQSVTGEPLSQESQSGLGYSWSGTFAIPGGGIANSIMRNDLKRLGLKRQHIGGVNLCQNYTE